MTAKEKVTIVLGIVVAIWIVIIPFIV